MSIDKKRASAEDLISSRFWRAFSCKENAADRVSRSASDFGSKSAPLAKSTFRPVRLAGWIGTALILTGCADGLDFDLRGRLGAFSTTNAVQDITTARPSPDNRGIISYPNYQVAVAQRGDSVATVAQRIGLPADDLARYNGLTPNIGLREGEILALPQRVAEPSAATGVDIAAIAGNAIETAPDTSQVSTSTLPPAATTPAAEPVRHKVSRGETAYTIARLYQVPVKVLGEWNGLGSDFAVREGQYLLIPVADAPPPAAPQSQDSVSKPGVGSSTPTPPSAAKPLPKETPAPQKAETKSPEPSAPIGKPSEDRSANAAMGFPVKGRIIRTYSKGRNDGIDIAADPGTAVRSAAAGTVAAITESTDNVPIVVVRHDDNLLTVYANVEKIRVSKGDRVRRGQRLAQLRPGDEAYLHFEVRQGFDSVDPMPYLE